ncbi:hypothetical protein Gotur_009976 [Gossypium turneri]
MARFPLIVQSERRKRIGLALTVWLKICTVANPVTTNSTDPRWKWFKNCLGVLDGTHIKIRVTTGYQPSTSKEFLI